LVKGLAEILQALFFIADFADWDFEYYRFIKMDFTDVSRKLLRFNSGGGDND
jgi:hypothetical protein